MPVLLCASADEHQHCGLTDPWWVWCAGRHGISMTGWRCLS